MTVLAQGGGVDATVFAAFTAGLLSFVSPCVLPLVPGYLSAVSGVAIVGAGEEREGRRDLSAVLFPAAIFCLSFTVIFVALGIFATGLSAPLKDQRELIERIAGVLLFLMGLFFALTPFVRLLNREFRPEGLIRRAGSGGPVIAGAAFAVGWTPCTGPILGSILTAASQRNGVAGGGFLLLAYSLGLAVPFMASAVAFERLSGTFRWLRDHYTVITVVSGVLLMILGVLVYRHEMTRLASEARDLLNGLGLGPVVRWAER